MFDEHFRYFLATRAPYVHFTSFRKQIKCEDLDFIRLKMET
jgi:hypothetical protein